MDDEYYKVMVLTVAAILVVSLTINVLLVSDPQSFSSAPIRVNGYLTAQGEPIQGYFFTPYSGASLSSIGGPVGNTSG